MISHSVETPRGTGAFFLSLVSSPPDKGGYFPRAFISFSTPPSYGHLPYILLCKTQRRRGYLILLLSLFFNPSVFLTPSPYGHSPYMAVPHRGRGLKSSLSPYAVFAPRNAAGHGRGEVKISFR